MCDVCKAAATGSAAAQRDVTAAALGALSTLANWPAAQPEDKRATLNQLLDKWRASKVGLGRRERQGLCGGQGW